MTRAGDNLKEKKTVWRILSHKDIVPARVFRSFIRSLRHRKIATITYLIAAYTLKSMIGLQNNIVIYWVARFSCVSSKSKGKTSFKHFILSTHSESESVSISFEFPGELSKIRSYWEMITRSSTVSCDSDHVPCMPNGSTICMNAICNALSFFLLLMLSCYEGGQSALFQIQIQLVESFLEGSPSHPTNNTEYK